MERIVFLVKSEQMKYPDHPEHPEHDHSREEENRKDGEKTDQTVKGQYELQSGFHPIALRIQKIRGPDPQDVLNAEKSSGHDLHYPEKRRISAQLIKGLQNDHKYVQNDVGHQNIVEYEARGIPLFTYLDDAEYFFLHSLTKTMLLV